MWGLLLFRMVYNYPMQTIFSVLETVLNFVIQLFHISVAFIGATLDLVVGLLASLKGILN